MQSLRYRAWEFLRFFCVFWAFFMGLLVGEESGGKEVRCDEKIFELGNCTFGLGWLRLLILM